MPPHRRGRRERRLPPRLPPPRGYEGGRPAWPAARHCPATTPPFAAAPARLAPTSSQHRRRRTPPAAHPSRQQRDRPSTNRLSLRPRQELCILRIRRFDPGRAVRRDIGGTGSQSVIGGLARRLRRQDACLVHLDRRRLIECSCSPGKVMVRRKPVVIKRPTIHVPLQAF